MHARFLTVGVPLVLGVVLAAGSAGAQTRRRGGGAATNAAPTAGTPTGGATGAATPGSGDSNDVRATVRNEGGRRVYVATGTIEVRGEIQRPYAFSLSGRSSLGYTYLEVPVHFIQEILNAVRRAPF